MPLSALWDPAAARKPIAQPPGGSVDGAVGHITRIVGTIVDVAFPPDQIPAILDALRTTNPRIDGRTGNLALEVSAHLGGNVVRAIAMDTTDGLQRGQAVIGTGRPLDVPLGEAVLGRRFDGAGEAADGLGPVRSAARWPIHRPPQPLSDRSGAVEVLETGIKVVDLLAPDGLADGHCRRPICRRDPHFYWDRAEGEVTGLAPSHDRHREAAPRQGHCPHLPSHPASAVGIS